MTALPAGEDRESNGSILRELIVNQYQAILLGGVLLASLVTLNPLPLVVWLGAELVLLPLLDSGPLRRWAARRRRERARKDWQERRKRVIASFTPEYSRRYAAMENVCRQIETNYQGLHGISQVYLSEQRGKLDQILEGCIERMTALHRYERTLADRPTERIEREIARLEQDLEQPDLNERARAAIRKNLELKRRLIASHADALGTMKALSTELDSMASLLEVLHQSSISMHDPDAFSDELDNIVRQAESSDRAVREMEALLRDSDPEWGVEPIVEPLVEPEPEESTRTGRGRGRGKVPRR